MKLLPHLLNGQTKTITGAAIILGAASLASRLLGLLRDRTLAHYFGAGPIMDAYQAAFKIPDLLYSLSIAGALAVGFIPVFTKLYVRARENKYQAWDLLNNTLNLLAVILAAAGLILAALMPYLVGLVAPGFVGEKRELTIMLARIMFLSPLFLGLSAVVGGALQSLKNFLIYALAPLFYNIGIIIGAIFFVPRLGPAGLAWGVGLGAFLHLIIQIPSLWQAGWRWRPVLNWREANFWLVVRLMIPRALGLGALQINMLVMTALASTLTAGGVAIFNYAYNLQTFSLGIVGVSFAVAAFPTLAALAAQNKKKEMIKSVARTSRQILFFIIPLSILFLMLRAQIVRVVLGSGEFDWNATVRTADTLAFFALSLFAQGLSPLLARAFYALKDAKTPLLIGLITVLVNIVGGWWLTRDKFDVEGLALAFSIASIVNAALFWILLRLRLGHLEENTTLLSFYKMTVGALLMGIAIQALKNLAAPWMDMEKFWGVLAQGMTAGLGGLVVYGLTGLILKNPEMLIFIETIRKKFVKKKALPINISEIREI